jgi:hypothetical protein
VSEAPRLLNGSKLMDMGRRSAWLALSFGDHPGIGHGSDSGVMGRAAVAPWRCCRGKAGHPSRQSVIGERGNFFGVVVATRIQRAGGGKAHRQLMAPQGGGGSVVLRGEGRPATWGREPAGLQRLRWQGGRR